MTKIEMVKEAIKKVAKKRRKTISFLNGEFGWEKWFQVELAHELSTIGCVTLEDRRLFGENAQLTPRKSKNSNAQIDITVHANGDTRGWLSAIEIKLAKTEAGLGDVLRDLIKISAVKDSKWDFRSVIVVFICSKKVGKTTSYKKVKDELCKYHGEVIYGRKMSDPFEFLVFGWEASEGRIRIMRRTNYREWFREIKKIFNANGISQETVRRKSLAQ